MKQKPGVPMIAAGFGSADLAEVFPVKKPFREPCEVRTFYLQSDDGLRTVWAVLDFMDFDLKTVLALKQALAAELLLDRSHIHIVTTHNHGSATCDAIDLTRLASLSAAAAREAVRNAVPALIRFARTRLEGQHNYIRRTFIPEAGGSATCFYGPAAENRFDSAPFAEHYLHALRDGQHVYTGFEPTSRPFVPFAPGDPELFAMEFIAAADRRPLGSLIRFSAHAVCCNNPAYYSSDYPWHVRETFSRLSGGTAVFLNGPCAEIAPGMESKKSGMEKRLGELLARTAWKSLESQPFTPLEQAADLTETVRLPVRPEVLENRICPLPEQLPADLPARKRYLEQLALRNTLPFLQAKYRSGEERVSDTIEIELGLLRLNQVRILAFPGETFNATAAGAAADWPDTVTVTEHGRTVMYIAPGTEFRQGGYESICAVTAPPAEAILRRAAENLLQRTSGQ